jgi:SAM-dependent methyltransferase
VQLAPFIVCPQTLGPLEPAEGGFYSPQAERLYPAAGGLVFMGYPAKDAAMIATTMAEEREHQGLGAEVAASNLSYLKEVAPLSVDFINELLPYVEGYHGKPRALELGSGNGWFSWLMAAAGLDTWLCDFEANTLATGMNLEHENLGEGRRFVCDARYAPIAGGSMDLVVFKEFVHHVEDYRALFREASRVLRPGGTMALMEPVRSVWRTLRELRHPDPHEGHHITWPDVYLRSIKGAGLEIDRQSVVYVEGGNTRQPMKWLKERAEAAVTEERPQGSLLTQAQLRLFGGAQLVVIARKVKELAPAPRPPMATIEPGTLVADEATLAAYAEFPEVLGEAAERIRR